MHLKAALASINLRNNNEFTGQSNENNVQLIYNAHAVISISTSTLWNQTRKPLPVLFPSSGTIQLWKLYQLHNFLDYKVLMSLHHNFF